MANKFMAHGGFDKDGVPISSLYDEYGGAKQLVNVTREKVSVPKIAPNSNETIVITPTDGEVWTNLFFIMALPLSVRNEDDDSLSVSFRIQQNSSLNQILKINSEDGKINIFPHDLSFGKINRPSKINNIIELHQYMSLFNFSKECNLIIEINNDSEYYTEKTELRIIKTIL